VDKLRVTRGAIPRNACDDGTSTIPAQKNIKFLATSSHGPITRDQPLIAVDRSPIQ